MFFSAATGFSACSVLLSPSSFMRRARRRRNRRPRHLPATTSPPCASSFLICSSRCRRCAASCASCRRRLPISRAFRLLCRCGWRNRRRRSAPRCPSIFRRRKRSRKLPRPTIGNCPMLLPRQNPPNPRRRPPSKPNPAPSPFLPTTTLSSPDANRHRVRVPHRRHPPPQMMQTIARLRRSPPSSAKTYC